MHIKPDIMTVLQGRMVAILYLMEQFTEMYKGQESHAKLLDAVRGGIRKLEPVFRMLPQKIKANIEGCAAEVIGEHAVEVCQLCANAGWFVAEIDSLIAQTAFELDPVLNDGLPFFVPESVSEEQILAIRNCLAKASTAFVGKINAKLEFDMIVENDFGL